MLETPPRDARRLLTESEISRVIADPQPYFLRPLTLQDFSRGFVYLRLHGSPDIYKSTYDDGRLEIYAEQIQTFLVKDRTVWCIFDNTTFDYATSNALKLESTCARLGWREACEVPFRF